MKVSTEAQTDLAKGAKVHDEVFEQLRDRIADEAEKLETDPANILLRLAADLLKNLLAAHSVIYGRGLHGKLDLTQPLPAICWEGAALLQQDEVPFDGEVHAAQRAYESVGNLLALLLLPPKDGHRVIEAAIEFGRADVVMTHAVTGLWEVMATAQANAEAAGKQAKARKDGGAKQAQNNKQLAEAWKALALPYAITMDARHSNATRDGMATFITEHFGKRVPGHRAVAQWLQKEAEQPNGPLRYRGRRKPI